MKALVSGKEKSKTASARGRAEFINHFNNMYMYKSALSFKFEKKFYLFL